jgi:hypothetical protein
LESVAGKGRRAFVQSRGQASEAILALKPVAYWRMDEFDASPASDHSGHQRAAAYEPGVVFFLDGPASDKFCRDDETNRAAHFAGGRMRASLPNIGDEYSVSLWFWNGMPDDARGTTGWIFSRGRNQGLGNGSDHVGLGGAETQPGRLIYQQANGEPAIGQDKIDRWTWNHLVVVRSQEGVVVYLNGKPDATRKPHDSQPSVAGLKDFFFGGRSDNDSNWEGRLDEIALFDRALTAEEAQTLAAP